MVFFHGVCLPLIASGVRMPAGGIEIDVQIDLRDREIDTPSTRRRANRHIQFDICTGGGAENGCHLELQPGLTTSAASGASTASHARCHGRDPLVSARTPPGAQRVRSGPDRIGQMFAGSVARDELGGDLGIHHLQ
ncbi:hypothetical protein QM806_38580 [Rhodococcus sp. IEGM 1351]|nr:hypothetical protein [Rhodococcus sp. IEGM 1351]